MTPNAQAPREPAKGKAQEKPSPDKNFFDVLIVEKGTRKPIPGAVIRYYTDPGELRFTTGPDGDAALPRPKHSDYSLVLDAWSDDHQQKRFWYDAKGPNPQRGPLPGAVTWELDSGALTVSGRVVGEDGQPVSGATVQLSGMRAGESASAFFGITTKTDADGRWSRHNMPKNLSRLSGSIQHPTFEESYLSRGNQRDIVPEAKAGTLVTKIYRGVPVRGRVLDQEGRPIKGAVLAQPNRAGLGLSIRPKAIADDQGKFEFPAAIDSGRGPMNLANFHTVSAAARGYQPDLRTLNYPKGSVDPIELEFRLQPGKTIHGRAFDHTGRPVAGAWVIIDEWKGFVWENNVELLYQTDENGRFAFDSASDDPFKIRISRRGYEGTTAITSPGDGAKIFKMEKSLAVELRVKDAITGAEVKRFEIERGRVGKDGEVTWTPGNPRSEVGVATRQATHLYGRGSAILPTDAPAWKLRVVAHGYRRLETREIRNDEGQIRLDLKLERLGFGEGGGPSGVIVDHNGKAIAGAEVMLSTMSQSASLQENSWWVGQGILAWSGAGTVITDEGGRFTFLPVDEHFWLGAVHPAVGYGEIEDADFNRSKKLVVHPWARVEGTVYDGSNKPLTGVQINLGDERPIADRARIGKHQRAVSDDSGKFVFEKVASGKKQLRLLRGNRFATNANVNVAPGETAKVTFGEHNNP
jgi:protocatechuate 3,4-dioxygenase beta subunit